MSKICKLKGEFQYIKYDESTKLDVINMISSCGLTRLEIPGHSDWILFSLFNPLTKEFMSKIEIITPGEYVVKLDASTLAHYNDITFNDTFFDKEIGE